MRIDQVLACNLKPAEYNPRALSQEEKQALAESLKRFGFVEPIIVNSAPGRENIVIGGHQRLLVAKELGIQEVPVHFVSITDPAKEKELNLRLNKNVGHWDWEKLEKMEFDQLLEVGFTKLELDENFKLDPVPAGIESESETLTESSETIPVVCPACSHHFEIKKNLSQKSSKAVY